MTMARPDQYPCPPPEILGAFVEGKLDPATRNRVKGHVASCSQCVFVVGETNLYLHHEGDDSDMEADEPHRGWRRTAAIAAAVAVVCALAAWMAEKRRDPLDELRRAAAAVPSRPVEGQLSGFTYLPYRTPRSDASQKDAILRLKAERIARMETTTDPRAWHARGVAALMLRNNIVAIADLQRAVALSPREPTYWNDLAAAHLASGASGKASELRDALSAAARATALDPSLSAAEFNRAIALERLGDFRAAAAAYDRCADLDPASRWTSEVRIRQARLPR
jgi:tetratricopeptide (TPR) repeat protein